jgi:hypothetical protein
METKKIQIISPIVSINQLFCNAATSATFQSNFLLQPFKKPATSLQRGSHGAL